MVPVIQLSVDFKIMKVYKVLLRIFSKMSNSETEEAQGLAMDCPVWREADNSWLFIYEKKNLSRNLNLGDSIINILAGLVSPGLDPPRVAGSFASSGNFQPPKVATSIIPCHFAKKYQRIYDF